MFKNEINHNRNEPMATSMVVIVKGHDHDQHYFTPDSNAVKETFDNLYGSVKRFNLWRHLFQPIADFVAWQRNQLMSKQPFLVVVV